MNIKKIGIGFAGFIIVTAGGVLLAPHLFKKQIQNAVIELSKEYLTTEMHMKDVSVSFFKNFPNLSVSLEELSLNAPEAFGNMKTVQTQSVDLGIDLLSLFGNQIKFTKLYVNNGQFNIVTDSLGNFSFALFKTSDEPSTNAAFNLALNKIVIKNSNVLYQDDLSKIKIETKNTSIEGKVQVTDQFIHFDTQADIFSLLAQVDQTVYIDQKPLKGTINTRVYLDPMKVEFMKNELLLAKLPIEIGGGLEMLANAIDFDLKVGSKNASLAELFSLVPQEYQQWYNGMTFEGTSDLFVSLKGVMQDSISNPDLKVQLELKNGKIFANDYFAHPVEQFQASVKVAMPQLHPDSLTIQIPSFNFALGDGFAKGKATYKMPMYVDAELNSQLNVTDLWKTLAIDGMKLQGNVALNGFVKGNYVATEKTLANGSLQTKIQEIPTFSIDAVWKDGFFQWNKMPTALDFVSFNLKATNTDGNYLHTAASFENIDVKSGSNFVKGKLKVDNLIDYNVDADLNAFVNLTEVKNIFPIKEVDFAGELTVTTKAKGRLDWAKNKIPVVASVIKLKNGYLKYNDLPDVPLEKISLETHISSPKGSMNDLHIKLLPISFVLANEPFQLNADLFNFNNLVFDIGTKGKLNLGNLYQVFKVEGWDVEGSVEADLKIKGKGGADEASSIRNRGFVLLKKIRVKSDYFPHDFVFQNGKFNFFRKQIKMSDVTMNYDKQRFVLNGHLENYINYFLSNNATLKGSLSVTTDFIDVNSFMAEASNSTSEGGVVLLPNHIAFDLTADAKKVRFNDLELYNLKGALQVAEQKLKVNQTTFDLIDTSFTLNATYEPISSRSALFDFDIQAQHFDIQKAYKELTLFREMVSAAESASGQVSLNYQLTGRLNADMYPVMPSLMGGGDLTLENIQFQGFKLFNAVAKETKTDALHDANIKNVVIKSTIENNVLTIPRTKFKIAGFRPRVEGQVTLDGNMNVGMRLGLPPFGIIGIPITVKGSADDFKISLGKYEEETLDETDEEYDAYLQSLQTEEEVTE